MNGRCVRIMGWAKSFQFAKENCETDAAKLAEPQTPCESDLLQYYLQIRGNVNSDAYIGIQFNETLSYVSTGKPVEFDYWYQNRKENCVHLRGHNPKGFWHDVPCNAGMLFICEKPLDRF